MQESTERFTISSISKCFRFVFTKDNHEKYFLTFDRSNMEPALQILGNWAADTELNFTWYDAAIAVRKIKTYFNYREIK